MATSQTPTMQDPITGIPTLQGWETRLSGGLLPTAGSLIAIHIVGISGLQQQAGRAASDTLQRELIHRIQQIVPGNGMLVRGNGNTFFAWLPLVSEAVAADFINRIRQTVCTIPISVPESAPVIPKVIMTSLAIAPNSSVRTALQQLERELVRQPEFNAAPTGISRATDTREELDHRLTAMGLFGRDQLVEQILASLRLPAPMPHTVIVAGPPQAGKTRMLNSLAKLFGGQRLPLAEISCRPADQSMPCTLLAAVIYQFLTAYPQDMLQQRLGSIYQGNPWLARLFPVLGNAENAPATPEDTVAVRRALESILLELARAIPHIAVIHSLHIADEESLASLAGMQGMTGHGLRIIAGADPLEDGQRLPENLNRFITPNATVFRLTPLDEQQLRAYVQELLPEVAQAELIDALYTATNGLPLAIELTLRTWAEDGALAYRDDQFTFNPTRIGGGQAARLNDRDHERLRKAALAGPVTIDFLCALWKSTLDDARQTIESGRALGYLSPIDFNRPDIVQFADQEHANLVLQGLDQPTRTAIHGEIATLLESTYAGNTQPFAQDLAYHFNQAGLAENAAAYLKQLQLTAPSLTPILVAPQATPIGGIESWDIIPAAAIDQDDYDTIIEAALAVRLAGVQFRLYPATSDMARTAVHDALTALQKLFFKRPSFILTFDGRTVAFDGQIIQRRDLQVAVKDFYNWMADANVRAIGFSATVREYELARFLQSIATFDPKDGQSNFLNKVALLNLTNIKVLTRSFQPDLPQVNMPMGNPLTPPSPITTPGTANDQEA
ncbi:MAG TPA: AAA family ATPase, partial [Armatimonadota bacterium]|nr:AAA family ATPase [Armatimonadota bacterium]